jgi:hypothetical protein
MKKGSLLLLASALVVFLPSQATVVPPFLASGWSRTEAPASPPGRLNAALAYDAGLRRVVLFGGESRAGLLSDTWFWDGRQWIQAHPAASPVTPDPPDRCTMVYYSAGSQLLLFCDIQTGSWVWTANTWRLTTPPVRLAGGVAAYDGARKQVVVFGGEATWTWDGSNWMETLPDTRPPAMSGMAIAYDSARAKVVVFGETDGATWLWDGTNWERKAPVHSPPKRSCYAMAYDQARSQVVLFGGEASPGQYLSDTWVWDGTEWRQKFPARAPNARSRHAMVYDAERQEVVLFGGETSQNGALPDDTWVWNGAEWSSRAAQEGR